MTLEELDKLLDNQKWLALQPSSFYHRFWLFNKNWSIRNSMSLRNIDDFCLEVWHTLDDGAEICLQCFSFRKTYYKKFLFFNIPYSDWDRENPLFRKYVKIHDEAVQYTKEQTRCRKQKIIDEGIAAQI